MIRKIKQLFVDVDWIPEILRIPVILHASKRLFYWLELIQALVFITVGMLGRVKSS